MKIQYQKLKYMSHLKTIIVQVTPFIQNASIIYCAETKKCAFVDPGGDIEIILEKAKQEELIPEKILLTHGHIDHAGGANELSEILNLEIEGPHLADKFLLDDLQRQGQMFGMMAQNCSPSKWLDEGDHVTIGNQILKVYFCPGHTPGHIIFYSHESKLAIVGDVLFQGSIGRTDLPGGNHKQLIHSIKDKLWPLGNDVDFIPGHGPMSSFGQERKSNAFVSDTMLNS
jgi:glyoxylase-like metal-dependent hydrolase (beta-lactamase superfamily II)